MKLDTQNWLEYTVDNLFSIDNGRGITAEEINNNPGDFAAVQSGEENNGVLGFIDHDYCVQQKYVLSDEPCLTVARSGSAGFVSYHPNGCVVGDSAKILKLKDYAHGSECVYLFLRTILSFIQYKYSYGRKVTIEKYAQETFRLPSLSQGQPDWQFMEDYIKSLQYKPIATHNRPNCIEFFTETWEEFRIGDFFDIHPTKAIDGVTSEDCVGYGYPLVVNSAENNGIAGLCNLEPTEAGNIITFSDTTDGNTFFYQPKPFIGFAHVQGMYPITREWSSYELLFLCAVLMFDSKDRYSYGRKMRRDIISEVKIKLPITHNEDGSILIDNTKKYSLEGYVPDWQFMEDYIKQLPYGDRI